ncbi:hypothetical protein PCAU_1973 [Pseudomonas chlororaphis subsp. aurantiaca]|uniref:hypothetical protein n=1 Tax=Pseudomonas chlororaphis TaxID=587753 RepID=UPI00086553C1|nr:hypothetical protein [Pseudomonas chlororaphis]BAV74182.1 hypothetical protein PCAU_1973 [Pseudomonas chlororaphis subsp. aurantiaca]
MEPINPAVWFPVVTLVAGALLKAAFDYLNEARQEARERRVRLEKRQETFLMQRIEAQRVLLPQLQESIVELMRATNLLHLEDLKNSRETGAWGKALVGDEISDRSLASFRQVGLYRVRIHDDELRDDIAKLCSLCSSAIYAKSEYEADEIMVSAGLFFSEVNERLGEVFRTLDAQEQAMLK